MRLVLNRAELAEAVGMVAGVIPAKPIKEALGFVMVHAGKNEVTIYGTDLEVGVQATIGAQIDEPGEVLLPGAKLQAILREIREDSVYIKSDITTAKIMAGSLEYELPTGANGSLPSLADNLIGNQPPFVSGLEGNDLSRLLDCTTYAAAKDSSRYAMMGCHLMPSGGGTNLEAVATDGRRLASAWCPMETHSGKEAIAVPVTVPLRACQLAQKIAHAAGKESLELNLWKNGILISGKSIKIQSNLIEGRFPDYKAVVPKDWQGQAKVKADDLAQAIRQAGVMVDQETRRMVFKFLTGELHLTAQAQAAGKSRVKLDLDYSGKPLEIHLNPAYMLDALKHMAGHDVEISLKDEKHPILLGVPNGKASCLVMPLS